MLYLLSAYHWVDLERLDSAVRILSAFLQRVGHLSISLYKSWIRKEKIEKIPRFCLVNSSGVCSVYTLLVSPTSPDSWVNWFWMSLLCLHYAFGTIDLVWSLEWRCYILQFAQFQCLKSSIKSKVRTQCPMTRHDHPRGGGGGGGGGAVKQPIIK
jgi:hypothetical protein